jgi:hypothetical protein
MEKKKVKIQDNQRLITPEFRVAFPNVFKPQAMKGGTPKFSVTMLFPQQDADLAQDEGMRPLRKAIVAAKIAAFGADKSRWPKCQSPIRDGATPLHHRAGVRRIRGPLGNQSHFQRELEARSVR